MKKEILTVIVICRSLEVDIECRLQMLKCLKGLVYEDCNCNNVEVDNDRDS